MWSLSHLAQDPEAENECHHFSCFYQRHQGSCACLLGPKLVSLSPLSHLSLFLVGHMYPPQPCSTMCWQREGLQSPCLVSGAKEPRCWRTFKSCFAPSSITCHMPVTLGFVQSLNMPTASSRPASRLLPLPEPLSLPQ